MYRQFGTNMFRPVMVWLCLSNNARRYDTNLRQHCREARVMDTIAESLRNFRNRISIPTSIPGLESQRAMVMTFIEGTPLNQLASRLEGYSQMQRRIASERVRAPPTAICLFFYCTPSHILFPDLANLAYPR